jgi:hypothetical protein
VPEKRIAVEARVTDPKGVKVARTYFRAGAQADYTFVPMQPAGGNRYVADAPGAQRQPRRRSSTSCSRRATTDGLAHGCVQRGGAQDRADPAWQTNDEVRRDVKVFFGSGRARRPSVSGFSDSITLDIVESGARLGAVAGLYSGSGGAAGGATAATTGTRERRPPTAAAVGGLSTAAIVGGVVAAGRVGGGGGQRWRRGGGSSPARRLHRPSRHTRATGREAGTLNARP